MNTFMPAKLDFSFYNLTFSMDFLLRKDTHSQRTLTLASLLHFHHAYRRARALTL